MEILNYTLWFTLVWWAALVIGITKANGDYIMGKREKDVDYKISLFNMNAYPLIAILLEYLIVRN